MSMTHKQPKGDNMKLIDNPDYEHTQVKWFEKHYMDTMSKLFKAKKYSTRHNKIKAITGTLGLIQTKDLPAFRELLNADGLKRLSNAIASAKKRRSSDKKPFQVSLNFMVIHKLEEMAEAKGMSMPEFLTDLTKDVK